MGPRFESVKVHQWPIGQVVKTAASHAVNIGSNPVWVTNFFLVFSIKNIDKAKLRCYNPFTVTSRKAFNYKRWLTAIQMSWY